MKSRNLGDGLTVSAISYGAMGLSEFYGERPSDSSSLTLLDAALEQGVSMIDTADMYGRGHNEQLIGRFIANHRTDHAAGRIQIATKFGIDRDPNDPYRRTINNHPDYIRKACDQSLSRLGVERIDLYYAHRIDSSADIAETLGVLSDLKRAGKIAHIGLCEVSAETIRKAQRLCPIAAVQSEYSLWTRDMEQTVLPTCRELGIGFVAYSPLGRGFLAGQSPSPGKSDFRLSNPRFQGDNYQHNLSLLPALRQIADNHGQSLAQTALAWLLAQEKNLAAIPGSRSINRIKENCAAANLELSPEEIAFLKSVFAADAIMGERYTPEGMKGLNA